jgi:hypothetical protein
MAVLIERHEAQVFEQCVSFRLEPRHQRPVGGETSQPSGEVHRECDDRQVAYLR